MLIKYIECMARRKARQHPHTTAFTYDPRSLIAERTGLSPKTIQRVGGELEKNGVLVLKKGPNGVIMYGFHSRCDFYHRRDTAQPLKYFQADVERLNGNICAAIIFNMFGYWIRTGKGDHFRELEGRTWRYDSIKNLSVSVYSGVFSRHKIDRAVRLLINKGLLLSRPYVRDGIRYPAYRWFAREDNGITTSNEAPQIDQSSLQIDQTENLINTVPIAANIGSSERDANLLIEKAPIDLAPLGHLKASETSRSDRTRPSMPPARKSPSAPSLEASTCQRASLLKKARQKAKLTSQLQLSMESEEIKNLLTSEIAEAKIKLQNSEGDSERRLREEIENVEDRGSIPKTCFGTEYFTHNPRCKKCLWKNSCSKAQPRKQQKEAANEFLSSKGGMKKLIAQDNSQNAHQTYAQCYEEVFGSSPNHSLGSAENLLQQAHSVNVPVRIYCLLAMVYRAEKLPHLGFYQKQLFNDSTLKGVERLLTSCRKKFSYADEVSLGNLLKRPATGRKVDWKISR
ncbi:MAG: hypothetical protein JWM68_1879 [Verrucomicrobiales bacterium]|nr:hypothetical protein [Verrucomicrobiales bacterium]